MAPSKVIRPIDRWLTAAGEPFRPHRHLHHNLTEGRVAQSIASSGWKQALMLRYRKIKVSPAPERSILPSITASEVAGGHSSSLQDANPVRSRVEGELVKKSCARPRRGGASARFAPPPNSPSLPFVTPSRPNATERGTCGSCFARSLFRHVPEPSLNQVPKRQ